MIPEQTAVKKKKHSAFPIYTRDGEYEGTILSRRLTVLKLTTGHTKNIQYTQGKTILNGLKMKPVKTFPDILKGKPRRSHIVYTGKNAVI